MKHFIYQKPVMSVVPIRMPEICQGSRGFQTTEFVENDFQQIEF